MNKLKKLYQRYRLIRWFWWLAVVIPGVPFVVVSLSLLLFMHWPRDYQDVTHIIYKPKLEYLTLSAHGVKDSPVSWSDTLQQTFAEKNDLPKSSVFQQVSLNWRPYSDNVFMCSVAGRNIGHQLGEKIAKLPSLKVVHLIAHSCGSFVIFGMCETLKHIRKDVFIQTTYLDPVSVYSGVFWHYGIKNFGSCADFSDAYIDTQDKVPGSNQALQHAYTFDVTSLNGKDGKVYPPHVWPTQFYIQAIKKTQLPVFAHPTAEFLARYTKNKLITWPLIYENTNE